MAIKLEVTEVAKLIRKADDKFFIAQKGQYDYNAHVNYTAEYISRNYKGKKPERKKNASTANKHRGSEKVPQLRL